MNAAAAFREAGFFPSNSTFYVDPESSELRELDVLVGWGKNVGGAYVNLMFPIQCKKSSFPWVLFCSGSEQASFSRADSGHVTASPLGKQLLFRAARDSDSLRDHRLVSGPDWTGYGLKEGIVKGNDTPYEAAITVIKATDHTLKEYEPDYTNEPVMQLLFPVVVLDAALYACFLDAEGAPQTRVIERGLLLWQRQPKLTQQRFIHIITKPALQSFAAEAAAFRDMLLDSGGEVLRKLSKRWHDEASKSANPEQ